MSSALAIAGVTAVLRDLIDAGLIEQQVSGTLGQGVTVSALPPDAIKLQADEPPRLNLFLHQVSANAAWRNAALPSRGADGHVLSNAPLALDLHYLVTAYGSMDLHGEVLLGSAMQVLHETPVLARDAIRTVFNQPMPPGSPLASVYQALRGCALAEQVEQIRITPAPINTEELSKLWTAMQARYRPTAAYQVSVVLIEARKPARSPLPVLTRGAKDPVTQRELGVAVQAGTTSPYPELESFKLTDERLEALPGDTLTLHGHALDGVGHTLRLTNLLQHVDRSIAPPVSASATDVAFTVPDDPAGLPAGPYLAALQLTHAGVPGVSNPRPLPLAPLITSIPLAVTLDAEGAITVPISFKPQARPTQSVSLIVGGVEVAAAPFAAPTAALSFLVPGLLPGDYWVRLRVDGVESPIVDRTQAPPVFNGPRLTVNP